MQPFFNVKLWQKELYLTWWEAVGSLVYAAICAKQ